MDTIRIDAGLPALPRDRTELRSTRRPESDLALANGPERARTSSGAETDGALHEPDGRRPPDERGERVRALLHDLARELQEEMLALGKHSLEITYEEDAARFVVAVVDSETREVIRQIPPEALLEARRQLDELRGLLFDERS